MFSFHFSKKKIHEVAKIFHKKKKTLLTTSAYNQSSVALYFFFSFLVAFLPIYE
jgi:hypothetical protein